MSVFPFSNYWYYLQASGDTTLWSLRILSDTAPSCHVSSGTDHSQAMTPPQGGREKLMLK